jgi:hypothetical protein
MKLNYALCSMLMFCIALHSVTSLQAQLYAGAGSTIYISAGDSIYINGNLDIANGALVTNNSTNGIQLTGIAHLDGEVNYTANGDQQILPFNHQVLGIDGSGNKLLSSNVNIGTSLQLGGNAKLVTGGNTISLLSGGSFISGMPAFGNSATSWVVTGNGAPGNGNAGLGAVKIESIGPAGRAGAVLFPVGPTVNTYNPITVNNSGTTDDFTVTVNDQPVPGAPANETVQNTWYVSEAVTGGSNVALGMQWNINDEGVSFVRAASAIVHSNGTTIDYFATNGFNVVSAPFNETGEGFTSFSPFGVTSNAAILPVNFLSLKAYRKASQIQVEWKVAAEQDVRYYEVQKSGTGANFKFAGQVLAVGNSAVQLDYGWPDNNPLKGANFYRIRSVDNNGSYKYSNVVKVNYDPGISFINIYPNPVVNNKLSLEFNNQTAGIYNINIISTAGAIVFKTKIIHNGANGAFTVQLPATLARELYDLKVDGPGNITTKLKLMIHQ